MSSRRVPTADHQPNRLRQGIRQMMTALMPRRLFLVSGAPGSGEICLTFDDGPDPVYTPPLLDVLKALNVRATFFVVGEAAAKHPEIVRRMAADGHEVGNHTWSHKHPHSLSSGEFVTELSRAADLIRELVGKPCLWFRPPHGKVLPPQLWRTWKSGQTVVLWNNDPKDYVRDSAAELSGALTATDTQSGDIVLMHDTRPYAAATLPAYIEEVRSRNLSFVTPQDWIRKG